MVKLAVKLDQAAALRKACGGEIPDLMQVAQTTVKAGAKALVVHLYPDQRHTTEEDIMDLKRNAKAPLLLEMAPSAERVKTALKLAPRMVCLVPESKEERSSEGGLILEGAAGKEIARAVEALKKKSIKVALKLDANAGIIRQGKKMGVDAVQLATDRYAAATNRAKREELLEDLNVASLLLRELGLEAHAGGGLDYDNIAQAAAMPGLDVVVVGAPVMARALMVGITAAVEELRDAIDEVCAVSSAI